MNTRTIHFTPLSELVNKADLAHGFESCFWDAFVERIDVSYGDATFTIIPKPVVQYVVDDMIWSESRCIEDEEDKEYIQFLSRLRNHLIQSGDWIDLEN